MGTRMNDLISREAALNCFHDWIDRRGDVHTPDEMAEYRALEALPSAQPEIIHCKDCKWKHGSECVRFADVRPFPDDFCSRAERREE